MHAFLIIGEDDELISYKVTELVSETKSKSIEFPFAKISDVRDLQKFTKLSFSQKTAVILKNVDEATEEASNAFLKNLEEPQKNLIYILTAKDEAGVLPTTLSRCQIVEIQNSCLAGRQAKGKIQNYNSKVTNFLSSTCGNKLAEISKIGKREEAISFLEELISVMQRMLVNGENVSNEIEKAYKALAALKANGNVQLQLIRFVVNIN